MKEYMPSFNNEKDFEAWNKEQRKKIPYDKNGMPSFKDFNHFKKVLKDIGIENPTQISSNTIIGIYKDK